ncbi:UDP-N-acetylmuramoyl-L-alanyl-D-glutamate--2,6-diaminopimelate ligase [candidate division WWE3 bacterium CG_4_9_14_0_2_um_filter_35_11]|uniref:UDP-N-acetylmuramyl-tripeptide synthetase n=1 Tax=candidate division WWE3 bacterium CG_4_9_14_0_2_um_filter_35_11 TaxID=1975077 RepID=A0A2M8EKZ3_UNCKA|nr:MAG: UDP-N-acetylmuramoyl-L-alanyl-D-glutamate--2,6-diaminopimelate ligase [candidate division WWE3 bacterium CG_4_9_14_0_2_um_filter_35_11]
MKIEVNGNSYEVNEIRTDSRKVQKGDLFIAYKGVKVDGHDYINQAIENGANVIVYDEGSPSSKRATLIKVENSREIWANLMSQKYDNPQKNLKFIGITGTDGKTTTSNFIYEILKGAGKKVGIISTVSAKYGDIEISTGLHTTSPGPDVLFKILSEMVDDNVEYVVLEVTSHALIHKRFFGIHFEVCGVTNVTPEHLDAHGSYEQLIKDKALLFEASNVITLNKSGTGISEISKYAKKEIIYSSPDDEFVSSLGDFFKGIFPGEYNLQNAALAVEISKKLGVDSAVAIMAVLNATPPKGRFHRIKNPFGINVIVDFAHTENAMRKVLSAVCEMKKPNEKLITVFGCAGERDFYKRPNMGKSSSELSDIVILTAEDPRSEDANEIIKQIINGNPSYEFIVEADRHNAIYKAIEMAKKGDWVLILGKGHEESMNISGTEYPWSDIKEAKSFFFKKRNDGDTLLS